MFALHIFSSLLGVIPLQKRAMQRSVPQGRERSTIEITYGSLSSQLVILKLWVAWRLCMKQLLPLRRRKEEGIYGREERWYAALCVTFIAVQEQKYQNQASSCCTRSHNSQGYQVITQDY